MGVLRVLLVVAAAIVTGNGVLYARRWIDPRDAPDCDDDERLPLVAAAAAFCSECAAVGLALVLYPIGWLLPPYSGRPDAPVRVVLIHGLGLNRGAFWLLARRFVRRGYCVSCFSYRTRGADIAAAAAELHHHLGALQHYRPAPVHLVAHGTGGLVARLCLRRFAAHGTRRMVTLGTPHQGTLLVPARVSGLARLHPSSPFLAQLNAGDHTPEQFGATAIQSEFDATIVPASHAYLPGALNVRVRGIGHVCLLFSRRVFELIIENLEAA